MTRYRLILLAALWGAAGCGSIDTMGRKLDMVSEHIASGRPVYEGRLKVARHVGSMVALQFSDGKDFDVSDCPTALVAGDEVRIYETDDGYAAHLWHTTENPLKS
jgi:hypothetical protein